MSELLGNPTRARVIENFLLVWLNFQSNEFDKHSLRQFQKMVDIIETFTDSEQCLDYLSQISNEKIFVISSHSFEPEFLSHLESMTQIQSIYFFSEKKVDYQSNQKIKGIYHQIEIICKELKQDIQQCQNDLTPISILSLKNLDDIDQSFLYARLIKEVLIDMNYTDKSKDDFVDFCYIQYIGNRYVLQILDEFERDYRKSSSSPIWWYTRDCFVSMMLNKALRVHDTELIIRIAFFIRDLHKQINQLYAEMDRSQSFIVYHGQGMSNMEFDKLFKNKGGLISFNNFLVTSTERQIASNRAKQSIKNGNFASIIFQMNINSSIASSPFTPLSDLSYSPSSGKEVLFSIHTIFRINDIKQLEDRLWQVDLTLIHDDDKELTPLTDYIRQNARAEIGVKRIAKLMQVLGKLDKAKEIYTALIETTVEEDKKELARLHHQLGVTNEEKDNLQNALSHYYRSLNCYLSYLPVNDPQLCSTYSNIGLVLKKLGNFEGALEYLQHALDIGLIALNSRPSEIAIRYNNIGGVLDAQGKATEALENYQYALEIEQKSLPPFHPLIGATHHSIGLVYHSMKDHSSALTHFMQTLEIDQKSLPPDHPSLGMTHANIAGVLEDLHRYKEAIEHAEKAVEIVRKVFGVDDPQTLMLQDYFEQLRQKQ